MLIRDKNRLFKEIERAELNPKEFSLIEEIKGKVKITYKETPLSFTISIHPNDVDSFSARQVNLTANFSSSSVSNRYRNSILTFDQTILCFTAWLKSHVALYKKEQVEKNLWEKQDIDELLNFDNIKLDEDVKFSELERDTVKFQLQDIKVFLIEHHSLSGKKLSKIEERMDSIELALKSPTLTKKDWKILAISIFASIAMTLEIPNIQTLMTPYKKKVQEVKIIKKIEKSQPNFI